MYLYNDGLILTMENNPLDLILTARNRKSSTKPSNSPSSTAVKTSIPRNTNS